MLKAENKEIEKELTFAANVLMKDSQKLFGVRSYRFRLIMESNGIKENEQITVIDAEKYVKKYMSQPVSG